MDVVNALDELVDVEAEDFAEAQRVAEEAKIMDEKAKAQVKLDEEEDKVVNDKFNKEKAEVEEATAWHNQQINDIMKAQEKLTQLEERKARSQLSKARGEFSEEDQRALEREYSAAQSQLVTEKAEAADAKKALAKEQAEMIEALAALQVEKEETANAKREAEQHRELAAKSKATAERCEMEVELAQDARRDVQEQMAKLSQQHHVDVVKHMDQLEKLKIELAEVVKREIHLKEEHTAQCERLSREKRELRQDLDALQTKFDKKDEEHWEGRHKLREELDGVKDQMAKLEHEAKSHNLAQREGSLGVAQVEKALKQAHNKTIERLKQEHTDQVGQLRQKIADVESTPVAQASRDDNDSYIYRLESTTAELKAEIAEVGLAMEEVAKGQELAVTELKQDLKIAKGTHAKEKEKMQATIQRLQAAHAVEREGWEQTSASEEDVPDQKELVGMLEGKIEALAGEASEARLALAGVLEELHELQEKTQRSQLTISNGRASSHEQCLQRVRSLETQLVQEAEMRSKSTSPGTPVSITMAQVQSFAAGLGTRGAGTAARGPVAAAPGTLGGFW